MIFMTIQVCGQVPVRTVVGMSADETGSTVGQMGNNLYAQQQMDLVAQRQIM